MTGEEVVTGTVLHYYYFQVSVGLMTATQPVIDSLHDLKCIGMLGADREDARRRVDDLFATIKSSPDVYELEYEVE